MVRASAGVPSQSFVAVAKLWRAAARTSAGIQCENIASAGTTSMQLTSSRERSFMVSYLAIWGPALPGRFQGRCATEAGGGTIAAGRRSFNPKSPAKTGEKSGKTFEIGRCGIILRAHQGTGCSGHGLWRRVGVENRHQPVW